MRAPLRPTGSPWSRKPVPLHRGGLATPGQILHKGTITQQSSAGRVFKGLGVAKRGHLAKRKESYAKSHPNGRSWLTTALSPRIILLCPVEAYPNLMSSNGPNRVRIESFFALIDTSRPRS